MKNKKLNAAKSAKNDEFYEIENEPNYLVSNSGAIFSKITNKILKGVVLKTGYVRVVLSNRKQRCVHRIVAETFISNPEGLPIVNHIDENPQNNCIENLEWVTHKENIQHSCKSVKSYKYKDCKHYETKAHIMSDFKRIGDRHNWDFNDFQLVDSGNKRGSNRLYFYFKKL